ncbi:MAG: Bacterial extracellular solute-binding protein [Gemmataceae bacterium]|nr:Bacterial extracellular solute-binding protein [Gemmataceae bacterium]
MQHLARAKLSFPTSLSSRWSSGRGTVAGTVLLATLSAGLAGCGGTTEGNHQQGQTDRPRAGTTLTVSCPDARLSAILFPMAKVWAARTGAKVEVTTDRMAPGDAVDVGVVEFADLGTWADRDELLPVPAALRDPGHPYQWSAVLGVYRVEPFAGWGGQLLGLPLTGTGHVIVYRTDRFEDPQAKQAFQTRFGRPLAAPTTWEEFADVATFFAGRDKRPSLPRVPTDAGPLADVFFRVAACYDRPALSDAAPGRGGDGPGRPESLAFHFRLDDPRPRLDTPAFRAAAAWLARVSEPAGRPAAGPADPAAALAEDRAVLAVLSLEDVARLKRGGKVAARFGIAPLPGTRSVVDPATGALIPTGANYIPHFAGGWIGVVRKGCKKPDASFDLLAELGGPPRSMEVIAAGGYGPFRDAHLEPGQVLVWLGYGLDAERTKTLQDALRHYVGKTVRNPTYGLRGPDHAALTAALGEELRKVAAGEVKPEEGVKRAAAAWEKASAGIPAEKLKEWRRRAAGLN